MDPGAQFNLIRSSKCKKECYKLVEGGFVYGKQRVIGDITYLQCEKENLPMQEYRLKAHKSSNALMNIFMIFI